LISISKIDVISRQLNAMSEYKTLIGTSEENRSYHLLQFDGGSSPNPGPSASGAVIWSPHPDGALRKKLCEEGLFISQGTNNIGEYNGLILGLRLALDYGIKKLRIEGDSLLVINQVIGSWKINNNVLRELHAKVKTLLREFEYIGIRHVLRHLNTDADALTKEIHSTKISFRREFKS